MYDGIENIGKGKHDSSSLVWKDLVGTRDFILNTAEAGRSSFVFNAFYMANINTSNNMWAAYSPNGTLINYRTGEIVGKCTEGHYDWLNVGSRLRGFYVGYISTHQTNGVLQGGTSESTFRINIDLSKPFAYTVVYDSNALSTSKPASMFYNGEQQTMTTGALTKYYQNTNCISLGGRYQVRDYGGSGYIYCLRIYARALTSEEIAHNYKVDKIRFNLP